MNAINPPTVGRMLWFWPEGSNTAKDQPRAAVVTYVHNDLSVDLFVFPRQEGDVAIWWKVLLLHGDERYQPIGHWCQWPPGPVKRETSAWPFPADGIVESQPDFALKDSLSIVKNEDGQR